jgi:hypothetical protein
LSVVQQRDDKDLREPSAASWAEHVGSDDGSSFAIAIMVGKGPALFPETMRSCHIGAGSPLSISFCMNHRSNKGDNGLDGRDDRFSSDHSL